jgi:hypothetical protein
LIALLRFHVFSGGRVALLAGVPMAAATVVTIGLQQNPAKYLEQLAAWIAGTPPSWTAMSVLFLISFGISQWAVPRVAMGSDGWIRHLPVSAMAHRIALILAVACAQAPLLVATTGAAALESWRTGTFAWPGFVVPPLVAVGAASLAMGLRRRRRAPARLRGFPQAVPFGARIALRALGAHLSGGWLAGAVPLGATVLFVRNNTLPPELVGMATRLGGALAVAFTMALLADGLAIRRPSWPWARSLPVGSVRRVAGDVAFLAAACSPIAAAVAVVEPSAALAVGAVIPLFATRAAAAMRRGGTARSAAAGPVLIEGAFAAGLVALVPWIALASLLIIPPAFRDAVTRDRSLKVTRWRALHHLPAGDSLSWTDR